MQEVRYCRLANAAGAGLPGLLVDRYDGHYIVQPLTRAMEARAQEVGRSLREVMDASSVLLRTDGALRARTALPAGAPRALLGSPPRWARLLELGARLTFDLLHGGEVGYPYDERELKRLIARVSFGAHVFEVNCRVGGLFVQAGLHGAKQIFATTESADQAELAEENAEANGLWGRTRVSVATPQAALEGLRSTFDLVLFRVPELGATEDRGEALLRLVRGAVRATRHGGQLVLAATSDTLPTHGFEDAIAVACELEGRLAHVLERPGMPADFPLVLGSPSAVTLNAAALELS
jgi:23S rRNA (cytosine1962-C5)-methyltransferase